MKTRILSLIAILCLAFPAYAQMNGANLWSSAVSQLGLTSAQQSALQPVFQSLQQQEQQVHESCRQQLSAILSQAQMAALRQQHQSRQGPPDLNSLGLSSEQLSRAQSVMQSVRTQMESLHASFKSQVEAQLTAEQRARFEQLLASMRPQRPQ
jgi:hypothetical protein